MSQAKNSVRVTDSTLDTATGQRIFTAGGEEQTTTGAQNASLAIENPAASGVILIVSGFLLQCDIPGPLTGQFFEDPTVTGGTTQTALNHYIGTSPAAANAVVTTGVDILSGGTELSPHVFFHENNPFKYDGAPFIIEPGKIVAIQVTGQTLTTINYKFNATWVEVPA